MKTSRRIGASLLALILVLFALLPSLALAEQPEDEAAPPAEEVVTQAPQPAPTTQPKAEPATEAPVAEAPVTEAPVTEAPVTEAPVTETPTTDAHTIEPSDNPSTKPPSDKLKQEIVDHQEVAIKAKGRIETPRANAEKNLDSLNRVHKDITEYVNSKIDKNDKKQAWLDAANEIRQHATTDFNSFERWASTIDRNIDSIQKIINENDFSEENAIKAKEFAEEADSSAKAIEDGVARINSYLKNIKRLHQAIKDYYEGAGTFSVGAKFFFTKAKPGETVTIAVPLRYEKADVDPLSSNSNPKGNKELSYNKNNAPGSYGLQLFDYISYASVSLVDDGSETFPFDLGSNSVSCTIIDTIEKENKDKIKKFGLSVNKNTQYPILYNTGFAVFEVPLKKELPGGADYPFDLVVDWATSDNKPQKRITLSQTISVTSEKNNENTDPGTDLPGGGFGGGGFSGGDGSAASVAAAKLMVDGIETNPKQVKAGDEFDLTFHLRNTSTKQALSNIKVTMATEEDALLPVAGSTSVYIPKIDKDTTHDMTMKVRARADIADKPVKIELSMEFDDKSGAAQTATQTILLNVAQVQRVQMDEPKLPSDGGQFNTNEAYTVTMGIFNLGKTTLHNVTAQIDTEGNPNLIAGQSFFGGNMEPGASATAELEISAIQEGEFTIPVKLTFEDANGKVTTETKSFTLFAVNPQEDPFMGMEPEPEPEPEPEITAMSVMALLPWWIYAIAGGLLIGLIFAISAKARRRHREALAEDEMD